MAEYIDRTQLEPDTEWSDYDDGFVSYSQSQIRSMPKADVVEREKVNKAIEEIEYLRAQYRNDTYYDCKHEVLEILRKHLGE